MSDATVERLFVDAKGDIMLKSPKYDKIVVAGMTKILEGRSGVPLKVPDYLILHQTSFISGICAAYEYLARNGMMDEAKLLDDQLTRLKREALEGVSK